MGWTHYWSRPTELHANKFAAAARDVQFLLTKLAIPVGGFDGTGDSVFTDDTIVFNSAGNGACEPFEIHQIEFARSGHDLVRSYCKTQHAPYDLAVQGALIILRQHLGPILQVTSDGGNEDWEEAREVCQSSFGYGLHFRLGS